MKTTPPKTAAPHTPQMDAAPPSNAPQLAIAPPLRLLPGIASAPPCRHGLAALQVAAFALDAAAINLEHNKDAARVCATVAPQLQAIERDAARIREATTPAPKMDARESGLPLLEAAAYALGKSAIKLERNAATRSPLVRAAIEKELTAIECDAARIRRVLIAAL